MTSARPGKARLSPRARVGVVALAALLALPVIAAFFTDHAARAAWEKRELAPWPALSDGKGLASGLEAYLDDHVGFALALNRFYRQLRFYVFRDNPVPNVINGRDGFVFLGSHRPGSPHAILQALCDERTRAGRRDRVVANLANLVFGVAALDLRPQVAVFPSKPALYPHALPDTVPESLRSACIDYARRDNLPSFLAAGAPEHIFYPLQAFLDARDEPHFYPPGNYHPAGLSAHRFSSGLLARVGIEVPADFGAGASLESVATDLGAMGFLVRQPAWEFPYHRFGVNRIDEQPDWIYRYYPRATDFATFDTSQPLSQRRALVLTNSFGAFIVPHLAPGFRQLVQVNLNDLEPGQFDALLGALLENFDFTDVIYLVHDTALINGYQLAPLAASFRRMNPGWSTGRG